MRKQSCVGRKSSTRFFLRQPSPLCSSTTVQTVCTPPKFHRRTHWDTILMLQFKHQLGINLQRRIYIFQLPLPSFFYKNFMSLLKQRFPSSCLFSTYLASFSARLPWASITLFRVLSTTRLNFVWVRVMKRYQAVFMGRVRVPAPATNLSPIPQRFAE